MSSSTSALSSLASAASTKPATSAPLDAVPSDSKHLTMTEALAKFPIQQLDDKSMTDYKTFVVGNDPIITGLEKYKAQKGKILIVGLEGMRVLQLACELAADEIPQIILVENSRKVMAFWKGIIEIAKSSDNAIRFLEKLDLFLTANKELYADLEGDEMNEIHGGIAKYPNQNIPLFFKNLFDKYTYQYVRQAIIDTVLIKQTWADKKMFMQINAMAQAMGIQKRNKFMFPSNVAPYVIDDGEVVAGNNIFENVQHFDPFLAIYSNLQFYALGAFPGRIELIENHTPSYVKAKLITEKDKRAAPAPFQHHPSCPHAHGYAHHHSHGHTHAFRFFPASVDAKELEASFGSVQFSKNYIVDVNGDSYVSTKNQETIDRLLEPFLDNEEKNRMVRGFVAVGILKAVFGDENNRKNNPKLSTF